MPPKPVSRLEQLEVEIEGEGRKWSALGVQPPPNLPDQMRAKTFAQMFEKLGITQEEMNIQLNENILEELKTIREEIEKTAAVGPKGMLMPKKPPLLGPDGQPII